MGISNLIYVLCASMSVGCAGLLIRGYARERSRLLLWASICFVCLALNNVLLFVDLAIFPHVDIWGSFWRAGIGAIGGVLLLYALIWELI